MLVCFNNVRMNPKVFQTLKNLAIFAFSYQKSEKDLTHFFFNIAHMKETMTEIIDMFKTASCQKIRQIWQV